MSGVSAQHSQEGNWAGGIWQETEEGTTTCLTFLGLLPCSYCNGLGREDPDEELASVSL